MTASERRHDIDWLRVITIDLLLIYHISIIFQPWGIYIGFIQSQESWESLWIPMSMLNIWRIPLLFFVSGMGVCFAIRKRNWKQLLAERSKRILLPFLFGVLCIVPLHVLIWHKYYDQEMSFSLNQGHLWFLANIFIYVILLSPLFFYLKKNKNGAFKKFLEQIFKTPFGFLFVLAPFVLETIIMRPEPFELYALTLHGFFLGFLAFFFGFCFIYSGKSFLNTILKWRWMFILLALGLYLVRLTIFELKSPGYLMAIESNIWIFAVLSFGYKNLNRPSKTLSYLSQAAYPIYILHMFFLYAASYVILPMDIPVIPKFLLIVSFTFIGCYGSYELIRRCIILRPLFGLKIKNSRQKQAKL
ncbi:acyltransferase family protein [Labilibaculum sp.]|uniref:acyltransferase family protein n=1 Tax=Labilibaculum sp. TaxID=2060723 RepID=UPI003563F3E6